MLDNNLPQDGNIDNTPSEELLNNMDLSDNDGFVDFIDQNFEEIKIAGCSRDSCFIWICK